ncbi:AraC family transcriptional regulator [Clostridium butyricum]
MNRTDFKKLIFPLSESEKEYRNNPKKSNPFYSNLERNGMKDSNGSFKFLTYNKMNVLGIYNTKNISNKKSISSICLNGYITLKKQTRYFNVPLHQHEFIGINYVYSGNTTVYTENDRIPLDEGSICLMDSDFIHTLGQAKENDIILNIQIDPEYLSNFLLPHLSNSGIVAKFLIDSFKAKKSRNHILVFNCHDNERLKNAIEDMFCESFEPDICSDELIENYLNIVFIEMIRNYKEHHISHKNSENYISEILRYINKNSLDCTLEDIANHFNFNSKYISRIIKSSTGKTFKELQLEIRMQKALLLIQNSNISINVIAEECGFKNQNFFYKNFKNIYNVTPGFYRKNLKSHD